MSTIHEPTLPLYRCASGLAKGADSFRQKSMLPSPSRNRPNPGVRFRDGPMVGIRLERSFDQMRERKKLGQC
jgi:hypothetical protein